MRFYPPCSNGKAPRKGNRAPMNQIRYSEEGDWESGFHYYGARYYWSETLTGWLSVDPMADKYPSISPYAYCAWNPVKLVDPDGCEVGDYYDRNGRWLGTDGKTDHVAYVAKSVTKNSKGLVVSADGVQKLSITNEELLDRATWVCGESGGSGEYISDRTQNAGDAASVADARVVDYYAYAINGTARCLSSEKVELRQINLASIPITEEATIVFTYYQ